jgi:hypothetical protein
MPKYPKTLISTSWSGGRSHTSDDAKRCCYRQVCGVGFDWNDEANDRYVGPAS